MAAYDLQQSIDNAFGVTAGVRDRANANGNWADSWKNMAAQYVLADQANAHEIEMWNMQNAYNTPKMQMQRFNDAGLNPMLIYSQGNPGNASGSPGTHAVNAEVSPDKDKSVRINNALSVINAVTSGISQILGVADQSMELGLKRNMLDWSNWDSAVAARSLLGFGFGNRAKQQGFLGSVQSAMDPSSPDFDPATFALLNRLGIPAYSTKFTTAEANASLAGARERYQNWYNGSFAPLLEKFKQGQIDIQDIQKEMLEYQKNAMTSMPEWMRGLLLPLIQLLGKFY